MMRHAHAFRPPRRMDAPVTKRMATIAGPPLPDPDSAPLFGQGLADKVPLILFSYDLYAQQLMHCNCHSHTIPDYESQELIDWGSQLMTKLLYADAQFQLTIGKRQEQLTNDRPLSWDCRVRHHNGHRRWLSIRVRAGAYAPDGQAREIIGSAEDVTNHHDAVEELRQNRYLLRPVLDLVPNLVYVYDLRLQHNTYMNLRIEHLLGGVLRNWGWQVNTAASGPVAIQLFKHRPFDLVLMDIQMPGMDGETAARVLRRYPDPVRAATPVITLTDRAQGGEAKRLHAAGFDGYLAKLYREEQLLHSTQTVLHSRNLVSEPASPCPNPTAVPTDTPPYDLSNVRQLVRQDKTIIRRLVRAFIETTPAILTALDKALTLAEWQDVGDAAHHLKSSLNGLGVESSRHIIREVDAYGDTLSTPTKRVIIDLRRGFPEQQK